MPFLPLPCTDPTTIPLVLGHICHQLQWLPEEPEAGPAPAAVPISHLRRHPLLRGGSGERRLLCCRGWTCDSRYHTRGFAPHPSAVLP